MKMKRNRSLGCADARLINTTTVAVRFSEVDSMRIVWHGEYVRYLEDGRESFGRQYTGIGYMDFYANGYTAPIVDLQMQYISPLRVNDVAIVETRYVDNLAAKLCFEYIIKRQADGIIVAKARTVQVFVDEKGEMSLNNPDFFEKWKKRWLI